MADNILGTVRASSWPELFDCAARWDYKVNQGIRGRSGGGAVVGVAVHKGSDVFDRATLEGKPVVIDEAIEAAANAAKNPVNEDGSPSDVDWGDEDEEITPSVAVDFAVKLTAKYCREVAPNMEYSGIEVKCKALDIETPDGVVRMTGTTDRIRIYPNATRGIMDFKSGGKAVEGIKSGTPRAVTRGHGMQLGAYTMMSEQETKTTLDGPASILGLQTNSKLHIAEGLVQNPKRALIGPQGKPGLIEIAAKMLKTGLFPPNPKSILCSSKWCPAHSVCPYHE